MAKRFAVGRRAYAYSQRTGQRVRYRDLVRDGQTGLLVDKSEYEPKHPQEIPLVDVVDAITLRNPMPDATKTNRRVIIVPTLDTTSFLPSSPHLGTIVLRRPVVS